MAALLTGLSVLYVFRTSRFSESMSLDVLSLDAVTIMIWSDEACRSDMRALCSFTD